VIAVKVRHENRGDVVRLDSGPLQGDEGRSAAVDEEREPGRVHEHRRLEAAGASESVSASQEPHPERHGVSQRTNHSRFRRMISRSRSGS
jgi:hypothetical protein